MDKSFSLDADNGKLMGVCSGFARWAKIDRGVARVLAVVLTLVTGPVAVVAYLAAGLVGSKR